MEVKHIEKKVFKKLRPINAKFFKKLGDEGRKSIKNAFDSLQAEKQTVDTINNYAFDNKKSTSNRHNDDTTEKNLELPKVPGERKILVQKVEIVFPPRRVSHYFSDAYHPHKHDNPILTCDNYCHTVQSTEEVSGYDVHTVQTVGSTDPTDITLTNSDETKNTELEQFSIDRVTSPTNSLKFTNKCPENRSNNIIPLKMKRIIRKPKIILRTSRFGKTQVLNHTPQQLPAVESIPTIDDIATRLDSAIEIPIKSVTNEEMLSECSKHGDIVKQEQDLELISIEPMVNFVTTDPQSNECNDEFHGFGFDEKSSQALVQIKHLEKVLHNFNNFQEHPEITTQSITPNISQFTEIETSTLVLEHNEPQNQTKDLNNFTFTKDDIERLNETLKNTNSCSVVEDVELENIKLKLIIKHLMDKLHVNTLQETFVFDEEAEVTKDDKKEATEEVFYAEEQGDDSIIIIETPPEPAILLGSPISSRHNSTESVFSEAASYKSTEVKVIDTPEVEIVTSSTLVDLVGEPLLKEKIVTASKVEKQTLKRSKNKIRSRSSSIELIFQPKKEKKNLIQTKICFNKQIDGKNNNITTSTPKALRRSIRSESTSSTNKNEMIRVDYVKESLTESFKNTATKFVPQSTDFCKVMEELNVSKKSKDPKVVVNDDVKSTSTKRDKHPRLSNRIKCEDDITVSNTIEVVPSTPTLHVAEKTLVAEVLKKKIKSNKNEVKEAKRKNVDKILNIDTKRIKKDVPEKRKRGRKSPKPPTKTTEKLEKAIESLVPYDKILTVLRFSSHVQNGRPTLQEKAAIEKTKKETKKLLEELKYFHCGSCKLDITKHKWHEHWINHGGIAWIDGFETSLNLNDWEDSLRRFVNNMKTYEVSSFVCAICSEERKSAMGHLSHIIICGFDEEVVESRKKQCSTCQARMFPCNYTYHKKMCTGLVELITDVKKEEEDEVESTNILDSSGRVKRKAVQKAEKKFKSMLKVFVNPLDNLKEKNGVFKCRLCVQSFSNQDVAINHIKTEHEQIDLIDTDDSASDASVNENSTSGESDGSSGDEESEIQTNSDHDGDVAFSVNNINNNNNNNSRKRATRPLHTSITHDSNEQIHVKICISNVVNELRKIHRISTETLKWTTESHRKNWINEVFPELVASVTVKLKPDAINLLKSLKFNTKSMKFMHKICSSVLQFEHQKNVKSDDWKQLNFADVKYDKQGITMFCGGQVSSLDWSPSNSKINYLAVASNNDDSRESNHILTQTQKSIIQIFQLNDLSINADKNDNCCKLMYGFVVDDGPVWSVKFCPTGAPTAQRIGLIAVSTSIGDVLVYSLPNIQNSGSYLLHLTASVVCKVKDELIFNDLFNQACQLTWYHNSNINLLTAGFLDGTVGIWDMNNMKSHKKEASSNIIYPSSVVSAHLERITALDIRSTKDAIYLITAGLDRRVRTFCMTATNVLYEVSNYQCKSRLFCAKWWHNWPQMLLGEDDCFTQNPLFMRNPYELAYRYHSFYAFSGSVMDITINNYLNTAMIVTDSGDVLGYEAPQLLICSDTKFKDKELQVHSFADFSKITTGAEEEEEIGVVFCDLKEPCSITNRKRRIDHLPYINNLQINQISFNPNENNNKFYALGYANGFVRVRFIPNPK